jgi:V/A-type H+-transporting ATPase subunit D
MSIKFQYNKTSLQALEKNLNMRVRALPTIKNKESALRVEVKKAKDEIKSLEQELENRILSYDKMLALWGEFDTSLLKVKDVRMSIKKIAAVRVPVLDEVLYEIKPYSLFNAPAWYTDGLAQLKELAQIGIEQVFAEQKVQLLEHARKKTTQKVNLFEKVQIPGYEDAILKIKRFMEDEENLSKSSQKIVKSRQERQREEELL